ncbi:PTS sugar transporter subunit IIB [Lactobacillus sp. YT155]|uniref:PTS sugar transporter subunit IIB n=1 Tax=Lactobacillus sp. YT155 TaxID=3060955 RepID=UPI0026600E69|nr:PTS sugar transporter subunit IIB [Lactobacillus sp. YT155]MDO1605824.1 PTS sugar transporter subunit IIB [Lactobacillus sp. YT155]
MIELIRADDRLVHGLVAVSWTNEIQPSILLVANDAAAGDPMTQTTMKMAKPAGVTMAIKSISDAIKILNNPKYSQRKIFVVTENLKDVYAITQEVPDINRVNVGTAGIHYQGDGVVNIVAGVKMTREEFDFAKKLNEMGAEVFAETAPSQEKVNFSGIKKAFENN